MQDSVNSYGEPESCYLSYVLYVHGEFGFSFITDAMS